MYKCIQKQITTKAVEHIHSLVLFIVNIFLIGICGGAYYEKCNSYFGASGSGTTTLGKKICEELGYTLMDTDDYFWMPTEPPFTFKRPKKERIELMKNDINKSENVVIAGSLTDWGYELIPYFTLAIRIEMKQSIRIERLLKREKKRYGSRIEPGGDMYQQHIDFIEWAKSYDNGGMDIRSKVMHDELQKSFSCKILYLDGENKLDDNFDKVLKVLDIKK